MIRFVTQSEAETVALGERLGALLRTPLMVTLEGDLGAGKTHLVKGIAAGMGITEDITSPTFSIVQEYETSAGELMLYHFDWYRIERAQMLEDIGYQDYLRRAAVWIVEWPSNAPEAVQPEHLAVTLSYTEREDEREIVFAARGDAAQTILNQLGGA